MGQPFYRERLKKYGIKVVTPNQKEREYINMVILDELCANKIENESKRGFIKIINRLREEEGAEGVILGCAEIPLLVKQEDVDIPVFDTTAIHSEAAVRYSLSTEISLKTIEASHFDMDSNLHPQAKSKNIDIPAFLYSANRLPDYINKIKRVIMAQSEDIFREKWYNRYYGMEKSLGPSL